LDLSPESIPLLRREGLRKGRDGGREGWRKGGWEGGKEGRGRRVEREREVNGRIYNRSVTMSKLAIFSSGLAQVSAAIANSSTSDSSLQQERICTLAQRKHTHC